MRRNLFEVDGPIIRATGVNSVLQLLHAVRLRIAAVNQRFGINEEEEGEYELSLLAFNVASVNCDVATGRVAKPTTLTEFASAVAREYEANLRAFEDLCSQQTCE